MPLVKIIGHKILAKPGAPIDYYGHKFIVQPNGEAHADLHPNFIASGLANKQFELVNPIVLEEEDPVALVETEPDINEFFPGDASDYFGCKTIGALNEKLRGIKRDMLIQFCQTRAKIPTPREMGKSTMVIKACNAVEEMAKAGD